ncbi:MAG: murein transglycosylase A [Alphaproteobacteria bacterium]
MLSIAPRLGLLLPLLMGLFVLTSCDKKEEKDMRAVLNLQPLKFSQIKSWEDDHHKQALDAFTQSCPRFLKSKKDVALDKDDLRFGSWDQWRAICQALGDAHITDDQDARLFFETHFTPHQVLADDKKDGLFTGYYVAELSGAEVETERFKYPIYAKPDDLVMVDLGLFRDDLKGRRIAGTVKDGRLYPYADRADIETKGLKDVPVLLWADDPVEVFFMHIQGSGRVRMVDGSTRFIGYAGQNGHPYTAIGKFLIEMNEVAKEDMSMQAIREWLNTHPAQRDDLLNKNASYVFFRDLDQNGAIGGQGVVLTPERSLAIDHTYYPYGMPFWLDAPHPTQPNTRLQRVMIGQDTGGAIRGPVRGDVFWGYGAEAERNAGPMKSEGTLVVLLPKA